MWSATVTGANSKLINVGQVRAKWSARGDRILSYHVDIAHTALNIHKEVSAPDRSILERKVQTLLSDWEVKHATLVKKQNATAGRELADQLGIEADARRQRLRSTLRHTLSVSDRVDWSRLEMREPYRVQPFKEEKPKTSPVPAPPSMRQVGFWDAVLGRRARIEAENREALASHEDRIAAQEKKHLRAIEDWRARKDAWDKDQAGEIKAHEAYCASENAKVAELRTSWLQGEPAAVVEHASLVLEASQYDAVILRLRTH